MIMVHPMPDEFMPGHMARFAYVNGFRSLSNFISDLASRSKAANNRGDTIEIYEHFCRLVNMDQDEYLSRHTMMPIDRLAALEESMVSSYGNPTITHQRTKLLKLGATAYFCSQCAEEDVKNFGFSYWRRIHQIHGVTWCITHGPSHLLSATDGSSNYDTQPHCTSGSRLKPPESHISNEAIFRYGLLSSSILLLATRYHRHHLANTLLLKPIEIELSIYWINNRRRRISDVCRELFPMDWLSCYFSSVSKGKKHLYCPSIDGTANSVQRIPGHNYILALSAVFGDRYMAIQALSNHNISAREIRYQQKAKKISLIRDRYFQLDGSYRLVAESIGISYKTAFMTLRTLGLPSLTTICGPLRNQILTFLSTASSDDLERWKVAYDEHYKYGNYRSAKSQSKVLSMSLEDVLLATSNVGNCLQSTPTLVHSED